MKAWAIPAAIIVATEYLFALAIGVRVGFQYQIPLATYMILGLTIAGLGIAAIVVVRLAKYAIQREAAPSRRLLTEIPYLTSFLVGVLLAALQIAVLTWTKVMLPIASPFWADSLLANLDHWVFQTDPWIVADRLLGWAAPLIDRAYITWAPIKFATLMFVVCMPESPTKSRALVSYFLMMAMVAMGQYLAPSAGPIFYEQLGLGGRFMGIPVEPWVSEARDYLWQDYLKVGGDIGGGISAMPSLHVAAALWITLVWNAYDRRAGLIGLVYLVLILVGSVLLGWHYAVDGIVGILITGVAWSVAPKIAKASIKSLSNRRAMEGSANPGRIGELSAQMRRL